MRLPLPATLLAITLFLGGCWHGPTQPPIPPVENGQTTPATTDGNNPTTTTTSEIDTADWETYVSTRYTSANKFKPYDIFPLFSIKYPKDWVVSEDLGGPNFSTPGLKPGSWPEKSGDARVSVGGFAYFDKTPSTADECLELFKIKNPNTNVSDIVFFTHSGLNSVVFNYTYANNIENKLRLYCFANGENTMSIHGRIFHTDRTDILDAMAKTFKFL